ncbi:Uncharacterised protein [Mycobacteroides abscessus subsp. abscessus]|nr:Uncharacterised protein [Mycobacteroides abscessus subsp. abscessus]
MHDVAVALDMAVVTDLDRTRRAHPAEVVAAEIDQHQMFGHFFLVGQQILGEQDVFLIGRPAPASARDRVGGRHSILHGDQGLRAGSNNRKRRSAFGVRRVQQIHIGAGIGDPQDPVHLEWVDIGFHFEAHARHHLECFAGFDVAHQLVHDGAVLLDSALTAIGRCRPVEMRDGRRQRLPEGGRHHIQPRHRAVVRLGDAFGGVIPIDRVGDQGDGALMVIDRCHIGGKQEQQIREPEVIGGKLR